MKIQGITQTDIKKSSRMITGVDTVVFSNRPAQLVIPIFEQRLRKIWPGMVVEVLGGDQNGGHIEMFYARDQEMYAAFDEMGYTSSETGESCFQVISRKINRVDLEVRVLSNTSPEVETEEYDSILIFDEAWEFTLVSPLHPSEDYFSNQIFTLLIEILRT